MTGPKALAGMKPATGKLPRVHTSALPKKFRAKTGRKPINPGKRAY